jgi:hypothetical protein
MAQIGYTPIQIYYSSTAAAVPLAADLLQGELAINVADGKLYYKNSSNVVQLLVAAGTGGGTVTSVTGSGGTTGLTLSGGPITSTGTLTIGGTLAIANGGTGQTTANAALNALLPNQATNSGKVLSTDGTNTSWITVSGGGGGTVTGVTATFPATSTGGTAPIIGIANGSGACTTSTGSGALVFSTSPTLTTPILGTPTSGNFSTGTFTWPTFNQNTTGTAAGLSTTLVATSGGTGQSSYAVGDLLYASTTTALSKLADVATGNALISGGVGVAPSWGKIGLTTHVSGTLPVANGGTGSTSTTYCNLTSNVTGTLPIANGGTGVTTSTGSGNNVLSTSPTLTTPILGTPTSGTLTNCTGYTYANLSGTVPTWNQNTTGNAATVTNGVVTTGSYANPPWITSLAGSKISGAVSSATTASGLSGTPNITVGTINSTSVNVSGGGGSSALTTTSSTVAACQLGGSGAGVARYNSVSDAINIIMPGAQFAFASYGACFNALNSPNWDVSSDINIKTNIRPLNSALDKIIALNPCHYEFKDKLGKTRTGFIAQEFEQVLPGHVTDGPVYEKYREFMNGAETMKSVSIDLFPYLVGAIKELSAKVDAQAAEIAALKAK